MRNAYQVLSQLDASKKKVLFSGIKYLVMALILFGGFSVMNALREASPTTQTALPAVIIHTVENQTLMVDPDEGREAYVVGTGKVVGSFRFIPIAFVDSPGRRELLTVPKSVGELSMNEPIVVRFLRVNNGLLGGDNYLLELVEPSFE